MDPKGTLRRLYRLIPDNARRAILVRRRSPHWLRAGLVFIHVPKAAGTSINDALYGRFMGHLHALDVKRWGSKSVLALPSFAVTRNPWDRLVSAYRFARRGAGVGGGIQAAVANPQQYRVPEFETFETFVTDWLRPRDVQRLDYIFQPQCLFICDPQGKILVDFLGKVEDLGPTSRFIARHIGRQPSLELANRSGPSIDYRGFYTPALAEMVGQIYHEDVTRFDYRF